MTMVIFGPLPSNANRLQLEGAKRREALPLGTTDAIEALKKHLGSTEGQAMIVLWDSDPPLAFCRALEDLCDETYPGAASKIREHAEAADSAFCRITVGRVGMDHIFAFSSDEGMLYKAKHLIEVLHTRTKVNGTEDMDPLPAPGWKAGLSAIGGRIDRDQWPTIPSGLMEYPPIRNILESAGQRALVSTDDGRSFTLLGFPDLTRASSKVFLIENRNEGEIIALHRHPGRVGILSGSGWLNPDSESAEELATQITGKGTAAKDLLAIDSSVVFFHHKGTVHSWDGNVKKDMGSIPRAKATLLLLWSQK
jgi:hypothetical protein